MAAQARPLSRPKYSDFAAPYTARPTLLVPPSAPQALLSAAGATRATTTTQSAPRIGAAPDAPYLDLTPMALESPALGTQRPTSPSARPSKPGWPLSKISRITTTVHLLLQESPAHPTSQASRHAWQGLLPNHDFPVGGEPPPPERGGGRPRAASIAPPISAPEILENPILSAIRNNRLLDLIRHSDSARQIRRTARLVGDLAAITSTLAMAFADLLFCTMSGDSTERLQQRFIVPLQAVEILNTLCAQPLVLSGAIGSFQRSIATLRRGCSEPSRASPASSSAPLTRPIFSTWSLSQLSSTRPRFSMPYSFSCSIETCLLLPSLSACHAPASATGQMTGAPFSQSAPIGAKAFQ